MCTACAPTFDPAAAEAFAGRMVDTMNSAALSLALSLGHRRGLFDAMSDGEPYTSRTLAAKAETSERYTREWLGAMTTGRIVEHDPDAGTYALPASHAAFLTRAAGADNFAGAMQWIGLMGGVESAVADAFGHGRGLPYSAYGERFHEVMEAESDNTVVAGLFDHILPLVPDLEERLEAGIDVLDVGCGRGKALRTLAARYPNSRFVGYDFLPETVAFANAEAQGAGLSNCRFEQRDATRLADERAFDLVTTFDAVHDQADPLAELVGIRRALKPGGVYLCQEIRAESDHAGNLDAPLGTFTYTVSLMHCMSVSLANGGPGLGAAWGRQLCRQYLDDAGFGSVERHELEHDIINDWYVCRA